MATEKQTQANRNNAKRSTGPRTEEGKMRASQNAVKHGLLARQTVIPGEDPAEYEAHLAGLEAEIQPASALERGLVRQIADAQWRMGRRARLEAAFFAASIDNARDLAKLTEPEHLRPGNENLILGTVMMRDAQSLVYFARYDAHLGRRFERAIQQLTRLRDAREKHQKEPVANAPNTPARETNPTAPAANRSSQPPATDNCQTNPISSNPNNINNLHHEIRQASSHPDPATLRNGRAQAHQDQNSPTHDPQAHQNAPTRRC